jgi:uncharacterized protein YndB with AHSA1/START domain
MKPVTVAVTIDRPREQVFELLADLPAHEAFTDHFLVDWRTTPDGVRVRLKGGGRAAESEIRVVELTPERIVEHGHDVRDGRHRTTGIYTLAPTADGGTRVTFTNELQPGGMRDRLTGPLIGAYLRRQNGRALERLRALLERS